MDIEQIRDELRRFAAERQWDQFHSPKNLATAIAVEAAELLEHFQWLTDAEWFTSLWDSVLCTQRALPLRASSA